MFIFFSQQGEQKAQQKMHYALREANDDCHKASEGGKGSIRRKLLEENKVSVNSKVIYCLYN